jgi:hypothetical protein
MRISKDVHAFNFIFIFFMDNSSFQLHGGREFIPFKGKLFFQDDKFLNRLDPGQGGIDKINLFLQEIFKNIAVGSLA